MTKLELIADIAERASITKAAAETALDATFASITDAIARGEEVRLPGFGTFERHHRPATEGRNPRTGEKIAVAARNVPRFKPGAALKGAVNG